MASGKTLMTSTLVDSLGTVLAASSWYNVRGCSPIQIHVALGAAALGQVQGSLRPTVPVSGMNEIVVQSVGVPGMFVLTTPLEWVRYVQTASGTAVTQVWMQGRKI